jgi:hypothetical protein
MQTKIIYNSLAFVFLGICGCALERIPASITTGELPTDYNVLQPCLWQSLPQEHTSLFPSIRFIECKVVGQLVPEKAEFEFEYATELRGKQSNKVVELVELETGNNGAIYYLNYAPEDGVQESLGTWCGWFEDSDPIETNGLFPNEEGEVRVESDGGMVYRAEWNVDTPPRGLAFILCGLGGLQHSSKMLGNALLEDGWAIAYVYTVMNAPDFRTKIELSNEKHFAISAIELLDLKYCQVIAATQAIRHRMEQQLPSLTSLPIVLIGISAGALNTPAVYHEMKEDVDAVVLVAGGANIFDIIRKGAFTKWRYTNDGHIFTEDELRNIAIEYLKQPSRDPYHLASELPYDNLLILHAKFDAVVPAKYGDLLWKRAGQPERWIFYGGHLGLFMTFDKHALAIADWLDEKLIDQNQLIKIN